MAREFNRTDRLADAVQRLLAQAIQFEIRDPRVGMVNINDVEVSRDLSFARVFVTFFFSGFGGLGSGGGGLGGALTICWVG